MNLARKLFFLLGLFFAFTGISSAQAVTGTPPFGSFGGGPLDSVDLGNLDVHISIPIFNKAGRGTPLTYNLSYDTSVWNPTTTFGGPVWIPVGNYGWVSNTTAQIGFNSNQATTTTDTCMFGGRQVSGPHYWYSNYQYHDKRATAHPFSGTASAPFGECDRNFYGFSATSTDGAGHSITVQSTVSAPVVARTGSGLIPPAPNTYSGAGTVTDPNGNQITASSGGVITDTLGTTALTIAGSGTPASPMTLTYTAPSGASAVYTVKYTALTLKTNFACSGRTDFGPGSVNLITEIDLPDQAVVSSDKYTFTYEATPGFSGDVTGRIASVTFPTGATINYTYTGGNNGIECADGSTSGLTRQTPDGTWTYTRTLGSGVASTTTVTDPQSNQTVINFQGNYPTESQVYQGSTSGTLLKTTLNCYDGSTPTGTPATCNAASITLPITQRATYVQWPGTTGLESEVNTTYNSYGLPTETDEYGYGTGAPGSVVRKTLTTYAILSNGIVGSPASVTVKDASNSVKAQTTYCYDEGTPSGTTTCAAAGSPTATSGTPQHVSIAGSRGNLTTIASLVSGTTILAETFTYYDTGNVSVATDVNSGQTSYTYGTGSCGNSFPTSVSEPLSLSKSIAWNCTGGVQTSATDENGKTVSTSYADAYFWRPNSTTDQLSNISNVAYTAQTSVESSLGFNGGNSSKDTLVTLDGLGRTHITQVKQSPSSSTYDSIETDYDSLGNPYRVTLPYSATSGQTCSGSCYSTSTSYDALGRASSIADGGGGTLSYTYSQNDAYQTAGPAPAGENTKRRQFEHDALGRLTSVCEVTTGTGSGACAQTSSATGYWTEYSYDVNNNLTGVNQNAQSSSNQTRTYAYDDLGRVTSETNPETGTKTYTYDTDTTCGTSKGDLVKKVDAAGSTTCLGYDALHRMTSITYSGTYASITPNRKFAYDSATVNGAPMANAKARMAEAYTCYSPCSTKLTDEGFSYTARGEVSDRYESTPNSGTYYHVSQSYWANGTPDVLSGLAALPNITYSVDGEGRVYSTAASSGQNPLSSTTYNVASQPLAVTFGSSDIDSFTYYPNNDRVKQYSFTVNGQSVVGNLTWNALGTLASLAVTDPFDSANAQTCSYGHDDLSRIASANCGSIWSQTFSYDAFGNINKSGSSSFGATYSSTTNQMTMIGSSAPSYDSNGNVTNDFLNSYAWDANGHAVTIDGVGITYDAFGSMVEQNRGGAYTQVVYGPSGAKFAIMNGSAVQKAFVQLTGGSVAVYNSSGLEYYHHSDWLKSSRLSSTPSRAMVSDGAYGPFGEPYAQIGASDLSFTGMNQDTASNVYDFPAREYGTQGRWPSPDPAGLLSIHLGVPQTLNRYAYVGNTPLSFIDPTGTDGCLSDTFRDQGNGDVVVAVDESGGGCGGGGGDGGYGDSGYGGSILFDLPEPGPPIFMPSQPPSCWGATCDEPAPPPTPGLPSSPPAPIAGGGGGTGKKSLLTCTVITGNKLSISNALSHIPGVGKFLQDGTWGRTAADALGAGNAVSGLLGAGQTFFGNSASGTELAQTGVAIMADPSMGLNPAIRAAGGQGIPSALEAVESGGGALTDVAAEGATGIGLIKLAADAALTLGAFSYCVYIH